MQFSVTPLWNNHSLKLRYIFELAKTEDETLQSVLPHAKMHSDICHEKTLSEVSRLLTSVLSFHAPLRVLKLQWHYGVRWRFFSYRWRFCVDIGINSVRLPLVTHHFDLLETCNKIAVNQYSVMPCEKNQFVLNYIAISTIKASHPFLPQRI